MERVHKQPEQLKVLLDWKVDLGREIDLERKVDIHRKVDLEQIAKLNIRVVPVRRRKSSRYPHATLVKETHQN